MSETTTRFPDLRWNVPPEDLENQLEELFERLRAETDGSCLSGGTLAKDLSQNKLIRSDSTRVRLLTACCLADIFRLNAPEVPYEDKNKLKSILEFLVEQFEYLQNDDEFCVEKSSYLIASLAKAKTLKLYLDLDTSSYFVAKVFTQLMAVVSSRSSHNLKEISGLVKRFMVDILASLVNDSESISDELIESMKEFLVGRDDCQIGTQLCREIISKAADGLESHMDRFFRTEIGQESVHMTCELFVELYSIIPQNLTCFLLQLDSKLESKHDNVRLEATELAAMLLASADLISACPSVPKSFVARYNDRKYEIRMKCVELSLPLLLNENALREEIVDAMKRRQHDVNESVRFQVVFTILKMAEKDITAARVLGLLDIVKERTLDTNFKVRRLALLGIGQLYRKFTSKPPPVGDSENEQDQEWQEDSEAAKKVDWIRNKVLHRYYQTSLQDRLIVERILYTCLVPFWLKSEERTQKLYQLFTTSDENAMRALVQILKFQHTYRQQLKAMMHLSDESTSDENREKLDTLVEFMAQQVSNDVGTKDLILEFLELVRESPTLHRHTTQVLEAKTFEEVNDNVRGIMKTLGNPNDALFATIKQLLERIAPLVVDSSGVSQIFESVREKLECVKEEEGRRCLELLCVLSEVHPGTFLAQGVLEELTDLLAETKWEPETNLLLVRILYNLRKKNIEEHFPQCAESLRKVLLKLLQNGSPKQAKLAVRCIHTLFEDAASCFSEALETLKRLVSKSTPHLETVLVSLGQIAGLRPECFNQHREHIIIEVAVKKILMQSQPTASKSKSRSSKSSNDDELPAATRRRLAAMKLITHALIGLANLYCAKAASADEERKKLMLEFMNWDAECTLRLLFTAIENEGDLMKSGNLSERERSHFRLRAAKSILKICCFKNYADIVTGAQFRSLTRIMTDSSLMVRENFCEKLHKRLLAFKLPLYFMALFSYGALEADGGLQEKIKDCLQVNIKKRRDHLEHHSIDPVTRTTILPDNVVGYVIHMLAHDHSLTSTDDMEALERIRECLWFQLQFHCCDDNGNYSFPFFRKLIETIKRSRDRENPHDVETNNRLYAVCDIALGLIMSRTSNFGHLVSSEKVQLPLKLFIQPSRNAAYNSKYYLPPELTFTPPPNRNRTPSAKANRTPSTKVKQTPARSSTTPARGRSTPRRKRKASRLKWSDEEEEDASEEG